LQRGARGLRATLVTPHRCQCTGASGSQDSTTELNNNLCDAGKACGSGFASTVYLVEQFDDLILLINRW
jgi:hypothetical protein